MSLSNKVKRDGLFVISRMILEALAIVAFSGA